MNDLNDKLANLKMSHSSSNIATLCLKGAILINCNLFFQAQL